MFITSAFAQATTSTPTAAPGGSLLDPSGPFGSLIMFVPVILIFWFLIFRPQQKRMKAHQQMLSNIARGDTVVTTGGLVGKVTKSVAGEDLEVEIAQGTRVKIARSGIADVRSKPAPVNDNKPA